jgi:lysozyme
MKVGKLSLGSRGAALIKLYEKYSARAYLPTKDDVPTIGWGSTRGVKMGDTITPAEGEARFRADVAGAEKVVNNLGLPLRQAQFDALVSLAFNCGTLGESIPKFLRAGEVYKACGMMFEWRKQAGKDLLGLARRRAQEMELFLEDGVK